jgi:hypothetical protein
MKTWFAVPALPCFGVGCWMSFKHITWFTIAPLVLGWMLLACAFISRCGPGWRGKLWSKVRYEVGFTLKSALTLVPGGLCVAVALVLKYSGGSPRDVWADGFVSLAAVLTAAVWLFCL